jgi:hypothetical protein
VDDSGVVRGRKKGDQSSGTNRSGCGCRPDTGDLGEHGNQVIQFHRNGLAGDPPLCRVKLDGKWLLSDDEENRGGKIDAGLLR